MQTKNYGLQTKHFWGMFCGLHYANDAHISATHRIARNHLFIYIFNVHNSLKVIFIKGVVNVTWRKNIVCHKSSGDFNLKEQRAITFSLRRKTSAKPTLLTHTLAPAVWLRDRGLVCRGGWECAYGVGVGGGRGLVKIRGPIYGSRGRCEKYSV